MFWALGIKLITLWLMLFNKFLYFLSLFLRQFWMISRHMSMILLKLCLKFRLKLFTMRLSYTKVLYLLFDLLFWQFFHFQWLNYLVKKIIWTFSNVFLNIIKDFVFFSIANQTRWWKHKGSSNLIGTGLTNFLIQRNFMSFFFVI